MATRVWALSAMRRRFDDNDIDGDILPELTADDLIGLGITSIGHRRKLLAAIAGFAPRHPPASRKRSQPPRRQRPNRPMPAPSVGSSR